MNQTETKKEIYCPNLTEHLKICKTPLKQFYRGAQRNTLSNSFIQRKYIRLSKVLECKKRMPS